MERLEIPVGLFLFCLYDFEQLVVFYGVVDRRGGKNGVEAPAVGGCVVLVQNGIDDGNFVLTAADFNRFFTFEIINVEAEHISVFNGVGDGIGV